MIIRKLIVRMIMQNVFDFLLHDSIYRHYIEFSPINSENRYSIVWKRKENK